MNGSRHDLRSIGQFLRATRQEDGLDLYDVSDRLRIRPAYLFAIEEGDYEVMPGATYALGFVRSYAESLGFDGDEVANEVKRQLGLARPEAPVAVLREPVPESRFPSHTAVFGSLGVALIAYALWVAAPRFPSDQVADVGAWPGEIGAYLSDLVERTNQEDASLGSEGRSSAGETAVDALASRNFDTPRFANEDAVAAPVLPELLESAEISGQPVPWTVLAPQPLGLEAETVELLTADDGETPITTVLRNTQFGEIDGSSRVVLIAREDSWVRVESVDGSYTWTRTLLTGERYLMPDRRDLALWTGNAGGLEVIIDGRSIGPLGERGTIMRDVVLLPEELLAALQ